MKNNISPKNSKDLRTQAEESLKSDPDRLGGMCLEDVHSVINELRVHQVELEMQNEELRRVQDSLEVSRSRYADLYDFAPVGYLTLNKQGQIIDLNLTAARQLGVERGRLLNTHFQYFVSQPDRNGFLSHLNAIFDKHERQIAEVRLSPNGGEQLDVRIESIYMAAEDGIGLCRTNMSDVTLRRRAEAESTRLAAENLQLQKAESLGRMAGAIAHLFNNQLSVVLGNLELALADLSEDAPIRESLIEAMRATRRSAEISGMMLTFLGQSTGMCGPLDLSEVCRQNLSMIQDTMPEGVAIETDLLSPGPLVRANANLMRQVLSHLITNALESMGHSAGTVTLTTGIVPAFEMSKSRLVPAGWKPAADTFSCMEVADTGCGIAEDDLDKIFDPFFTTKFTGRGLGLPVILGIVKNLGGAIGVESKENQGSIFRVFLPVPADELFPSSGKATGAQQTESGGTVLLVEDQDPVRNTAESMLKRLGYEVLPASCGAEAVNLLREKPNRIRCVITDLGMPGMDGWATLAALRKIRPHIPVILVSGYDDALVMTGNFSEQPRVFLHKPYSMGDMQAAIDTALKKPAGTG